ncbi:MAG: hypothetical protein M5U28_54800 [Sandaracinaceae bacterium]|nr:hypothetical protein [Sandaracinaceae bacterium]
MFCASVPALDEVVVRELLVAARRQLAPAMATYGHMMAGIVDEDDPESFATFK